ncbi:MAG: PadR family transcriptional regulator [Terracidiphilus sp.]|jgi:DNA-binding PadR family transcriptional regulator
MKLRLSPQTVLVLDAFLEQPEEWKYGYDLSRVTGLKSGTLYPILMRMAERKLLETEWEAGEPGKPPRHMYRFTPDGLRFARANRTAHASGGLGQVALERNPSKTALAKSMRGGFFLRKKPLGVVLPRYGYSGFAVGLVEG